MCCPTVLSIRLPAFTVTPLQSSGINALQVDHRNEEGFFTEQAILD